MTTYNIAMLVGSSRQGSLNARLAKAIEKNAPDSLVFKPVAMDNLPFYNADLEDNRPDSVNGFTTAIRAADAICIVTPEYNRSIPGMLKNAIDWGSKPMAENVWSNKAIAMTGTSPGAIGTAIAQQHLRQILSILGAYVMPGETYISFKPADLIDDNGNVSEDRVRDFIAAFGRRFASLIQRLEE